MTTLSRAADRLARIVTALAVIFVLLNVWNVAGDVGRELAAVLSEDAR